MEDLEKLKTRSLEALSQARGSEQVETLRVKLLGKKGEITTLMKGLGKLSHDERPKAGAACNKVKVALESAIEKKLSDIRAAEMTSRLEEESFDITIPGRENGAGRFHPVGMVMEELVEIFIGLGFEVAEGPEVETDEYNFKKLNFPDDHPARDMQDTFYVQNGARLLRTHTSPVQIHAMLKHKPPLSVIAPGRVYRCDSDITHSPVFHQLEGFHVDKNVNFGHLKGTLELFLQRLYGGKTKIRLRPSYFPFTEPSAEVDVSCQICGGDGCRVCKGTGWLEILGAGMIDPNVFEAVGYDPEVWTGFAFGCGIERIAMRKYAIDDIRLLYNNDTRFLSQF
ncbi:Phenylalanyl-tRNA synthetase alpha chain [hydrothermal vent metagenome]|uniref:Phenylalanine--tRNA ligase alpha subunit n=1 Tax=hydrothermal vent metagenome TaxID=652676 RepID=A0A3B1CCF3_9ZZZZ